MTGALITTPTSDRAQSPLHLVGDKHSSPPSEAQRLPRQISRYSHTTDTDSPPVLLAGTDAESRSAMLGELRNLLPAGTCFVEASEAWELLLRAQTSRMVVLIDDLGDVSSASLVRLLGRRHPGLPVLAVEGRVSAGDPRDAGATDV